MKIYHYDTNRKDEKAASLIAFAFGDVLGGIVALIVVVPLFVIADRLKARSTSGFVALFLWAVAAALLVWLLDRFQIARAKVTGWSLFLLTAVSLGLLLLP